MQDAVIDHILRHTKVKICSERDVYNGDTLGNEFMKFIPFKFTHSSFVAIEVKYSRNDYHQSVMNKYDIGGTRDGRMFAPGFYDPVWIWDVTIDGTHFFVIGPRAFKRKYPDQFIIEKMVRDEKLYMYATEIAELEKRIRDQTLLTDTQEIEPDALEMLERTQPGPFGHGPPGQHHGLFQTTHQRPLQTKQERDRDWQMGLNRLLGLNHPLQSELDVPIEWQVCIEK